MTQDQNLYLLYKTKNRLEELDLWSDPTYRERALYELSVINKMGFASYYLVVADYVDWALSNGIAVGPGRGSGAGSLVAYAVGITQIDPIKRGLMFERFLNPGRQSMPDFDIDFSRKNRSKVLDYLIKKYGEEYVCQIGTIGTMKSKLAIKDVGRTCGLDFETTNRFTSYVPDEARGGQGAHAVTLRDCLNPSPEFLKEHYSEMQSFQEMYKTNKDFHDVINMAAGIEGVPKSFGVHAAGVIIGTKPLASEIPLRASKDGSPVSQWTDKQVESMGFVKFDFLGLRTLDVIYEACESIKRRTGLELDWDKVDERDSRVYTMLAAGDTFGVFQLEASGISDFTRQFKPESIEDISTISALYRPGPLDNNMTDAILSVRRGEDKPNYPVKEIEAILEETNGVLTYQEQVLKIAQDMAGFSLGDADLLRRAIGKKLPEAMAEQRKKFIDGSIKRGHTFSISNEIYDMIEKFADYCFNKAHSFAYSVLSFRTAYLKCHYPSDFYAAELSSWDGDAEKITLVIDDARAHGIQILPPDINISGLDFTSVDDTTVRVGLNAIKGLGSAGIDEILEARLKGDFDSLEDLCLTVSSKLKKNNLVALAYSGALSNIADGMNVVEIATYLPELVDALKKRKALQSKGQMSLGSLFDSSKDSGFEEVHVIKPTIPVNNFDLLDFEKESLGFYLSGTKLDFFSKIKESIAIDDISSLEIEGLHVTLLCIITSVRVIQGKRGRFAFVDVKDASGSILVKIWSNNIDSVIHNLVEGNIVVIRGKTSHYKGIEVIATDVVAAEFEIQRLNSRIVLNELSYSILNRILKLEKGNVPIDYEDKNSTFRYRLGFFDVPLSYFGGV